MKNGKIIRNNTINTISKKSFYKSNTKNKNYETYNTLEIRNKEDEELIKSLSKDARDFFTRTISHPKNYNSTKYINNYQTTNFFYVVPAIKEISDIDSKSKIGFLHNTPLFENKICYSNMMNYNINNNDNNNTENDNLSCYINKYINYNNINLIKSLSGKTNNNINNRKANTINFTTQTNYNSERSKKKQNNMNEPINSMSRCYSPTNTNSEYLCKSIESFDNYPYNIDNKPPFNLGSVLSLTMKNQSKSRFEQKEIIEKNITSIEKKKKKNSLNLHKCNLHKRELSDEIMKTIENSKKYDTHEINHTREMIPKIKERINNMRNQLTKTFRDIQMMEVYMLKLNKDIIYLEDISKDINKKIEKQLKINKKIDDELKIYRAKNKSIKLQINNMMLDNEIFKDVKKLMVI